ncbi:MAG: V-type ATPase subunit [Caldisericia bacterium]|jgi:vacuolar-type H+-ATPase subunit C/Vma6|nr:V-type ATPase subunit [Caldisericia bacterium]
MKLKNSDFSYLSAKSLILISYFPKIENLKSYLSLSKEAFVDHIKKSYGIETESQNLDEILTFDWNNNIKKLKSIIFDEKLYQYFEIEKEYEIIESDKNIFEKEYEKIKKELFLLNSSEFFKKFIKLKIDLFNILSFLKHKYFGFSFKYIDGGNLIERIFKLFEKESIQNFIEYINLRYPKTIEKTPELFFELFEKKRDDLLINYLKNSKYFVFGPEIVFSFLVLKSFNNVNFRLIYNGIIYNLPHEDVLRRLRVING